MGLYKQSPLVGASFAGKFQHKKSARVSSADTTIDFHQKLATIMFLTRLVIVQNIHSALPSTPAVVVSTPW